jgi:hypothetical protein
MLKMFEVMIKAIIEIARTSQPDGGIILISTIEQALIFTILDIDSIIITKEKIIVLLPCL